MSSSAVPRRRYIAKEDLSLGSSGFLFDARTGESYTLSPTGLTILRSLLAGCSSDDVWRDVVREFDVPDGRARWDTERFLARLAELGLVRPAPAPEASGAPGSSHG